MRKFLPLLAALLLVSSCTASTPADETAAPDAAEGDVASEVEGRDLGHSFETTGFELRRPEKLPYAFDAGTGFPLDDADTVVDAEGVKVTDWPGRGETYHPVALAQYGLYMLESYRATSEPEYLRRAEANAHALLAGAEMIDGALWFPYPFAYQLHSDGNMPLPAPWYSGMAQGQALSLFTRLNEVTGGEGWLSHAHEVFASFDSESDSSPSFIHVSEDGKLWLEEYVAAGLPATHVVNGHIYSAFGLFDYAMATGDETAAMLFDGAATTVVQEFQEYREPGQISYYCAGQYCKDTAWQPASYHRGVARQFDQLAAMTGDAVFRDMARAFREDYAASGATG